MIKSFSYKLRSAIFIFTIVATIVANKVIVINSIDVQLEDAKIINIAGRQRMLSQQITKELYAEKINKATTIEERLAPLLKEFKSNHQFLRFENTRFAENIIITDLFRTLEPFYESIIKIANNTNKISPTVGETKFETIESNFLETMNTIVLEYAKSSKKELENTKEKGIILSILSILILLGQFVFIIIPLLRSLKKKNEILNQKNQKLSDFTNITSHNLRAPIGNLKSLLSFYGTATDEEDRAEIIDKLNTVVSSIDTTMNTLIESIKVRNVKTTKKEPVLFSKTLAKTKDDMHLDITKANAKITADFSAIDLVQYNKLYLESIFFNLISNAIKYKSPERPVEINITSQKLANKTVLTFSDNGLGIDLKRHGSKLFGLSKTFHKHPDAKGIGLYMTKEQIESQNGTITAKSTVDVGTDFIITI